MTSRMIHSANKNKQQIAPESSMNSSDLLSTLFVPILPFLLRLSCEQARLSQAQPTNEFSVMRQVSKCFLCICVDSPKVSASHSNYLFKAETFAPSDNHSHLLLFLLNVSLLKVKFTLECIMGWKFPRRLWAMRSHTRCQTPPSTIKYAKSHFDFKSTIVQVESLWFMANEKSLMASKRFICNWAMLQLDGVSKSRFRGSQAQWASNQIWSQLIARRREEKKSSNFLWQWGEFLSEKLHSNYFASSWRVAISAIYF